MNLHEYQTKELLENWNIPIPKFGVASNVEEAKKIISKLNLSQAVIKIQVHAGGRGKAGGVKFAKTKQEIEKACHDLIGMKMVNNQTGAEGVVAKKVMITQPVDIGKEFYIAVAIDRKKAARILIASKDGGMDIEEVAHKTPEKILKIPIPLSGDLRQYQLLQLANFMGWKDSLAKQGASIAKALAKCFIKTDASLLEINPLVETTEGKLSAVDAKLSIDDSAFFRQKEIAKYYDPSQVSQAEAKAKEFDLAYIAMDGKVGCMVNGAGLAMATMDIIQLYGVKPANFLDVGGGASKDKVAAGFRIILSDPKVKAVLVNIFGGIMNCEVLAEGILLAAKELKIHVPLIVRMEGTNVEKGKKLLADSHLSIFTAKDLDEAAKLASSKVKGK